MAKQKTKKPIKTKAKAKKKSLPKPPTSLHGMTFRSLTSHFGRPRKFKTAAKLAEACEIYLKWVEENPRRIAKAFSSEGTIIYSSLPAPRAPTLRALCASIGIAHRTWNQWKDPESVNYRLDFSPTQTLIEEIMYEEKFSAAAVGLMNPAFIGKAIGLSEKVEITGNEGGPIETIDSSLTPVQQISAFREILDNINKDQND